MKLDSEKIGALLKEELLASVELNIRRGVPVTIMVRGWSMFPLLRNLKDSVELFPITDDLKCGDVVVFKYKERFLLHRIVRIDGENLIIKGDGVPFDYEMVTRLDVLAIMKNVIKRDKKVLSTCSKAWQNRSRIWNALPAVIQYVILRPAVIIDKLLNGN